MIGKRTTRGGQAVPLAALGGVIGPVLFVIVVVGAGVAYDGYSHATQKISELGGEGAEYAILENVNPAILGALILGFSWALARARVRCGRGCRGETTIGPAHNDTGLSAFIASGAVGGLVWFVVTQGADIQSLAGIAQRTFAGALLLWVAVTAWRLRHLSTSPLDVAAGAATARYAGTVSTSALTLVLDHGNTCVAASPIERGL